MANKHVHSGRVKKQLSQKRHFRREMKNLIQEIIGDPDIIEDSNFIIQNVGWETKNYR